MRVIAGTARSIPLFAPPGLNTRPTTDKIKETLFNILHYDVRDCLFVDIFAGSGAIGIEALSRGAARAVFIDSAKSAADCIEKNLAKCRFTDRARVIRSDALSGVSRLGNELSHDGPRIFFLDPPYGKGLAYPVLKYLAESGALRDGDLAILEELKEEDVSCVEELGLSISRVKEYRIQKHVFMRRAFKNGKGEL